MYGIKAVNVETGSRVILTGMYRNLIVAEEVVRTLQSAQRVMRADSAFNFESYKLS